MTDSEWATTSCISRAIRARSSWAASRLVLSRSRSRDAARSRSVSRVIRRCRARAPSAQDTSTSRQLLIAQLTALATEGVKPAPATPGVRNQSIAPTTPPASPTSNHRWRHRTLL
nr:hypothetical protein [Arsenicicoccus piscis]